MTNTFTVDSTTLLRSAWTFCSYESTYRHHVTEAAGMSAKAAPGLPAAISRAQLYFWSRKWQSDELESLREHASGQYVEFDDDEPGSVARWLLDD